MNNNADTTLYRGLKTIPNDRCPLLIFAMKVLISIGLRCILNFDGSSFGATVGRGVSFVTQVNFSSLLKSSNNWFAPRVVSFRSVMWTFSNRFWNVNMRNRTKSVVIWWIYILTQKSFSQKIYFWGNDICESLLFLTVSWKNVCLGPYL